MMPRIFLDTNIVVDFLGKREPFYLPAAKLMMFAERGELMLYTSAISIANINYLLAKTVGRQSAAELLRKFRLLCKIAKVDEFIVDQALASNFTDYEDALQYYSALASGCEIIITRNEKDFRASKIPVMDAHAFLQLRNQII